MQMWNPDMNRVTVSHDVIWLKCVFYVARKTLEPLELDNDARADDAFDEDEALVGDDGSDTVSENGDEDESPDHESIAGDTVINNTTVTQIGCTVKMPDRLIKSMGVLAGIQGTAVKLKYVACMAELDNNEVAATEILLVGAGIGGGFSNTTELKVMKYKEAMIGEDDEA